MRGRKIKQIVSLLMVMTLIVGNSASVIGAGGGKPGKTFHILDGAGAKIINQLERRTPYTPTPGADMVTITINHVLGPGGTTIGTETKMYRSGNRYSIKPEQAPANYVLDKIYMSSGTGGSSITPNVAKNTVVVDLHTTSTPRKPTGKLNAPVINFYYKPIPSKPKEVAVLIGEGSQGPGDAGGEDNPTPPPKPTPPPVPVIPKEGTKPKDTIYKEIVKEIKEQVPDKKTEEVIKDTLLHADAIWKNMAVTIAEFFAGAGALPNDIDYRKREIKQVSNADNFLTDAEINNFINKVGETQLKKNILSAVNESIDSAYDTNSGHPATANMHMHALEGDKAGYNFKTLVEGRSFQHLPFIHSINQLRTLIPYSNETLGKNAVNNRAVGYGIADEVLTNMLYPDVPGSGDYSTRQFGKNPMENPTFVNLLRNNGLDVNSGSGTLLREVANENKEWADKIVDSAIIGINRMVNESGFREWTPERTFNYLDGSLKQDNLNELTEAKLNGWYDSLVIMEYPSDYTWGYGIMHNLLGYYTTVPLAPFLGVIDLAIEEVYTEWDEEDGVYATIFKYEVDKMPNLPGELDEFMPLITLGVDKGKIKTTTLGGIPSDGVEFQAGNGYIRKYDGANSVLMNLVYVEWAPDEKLKEDEKALLYATVNLIPEKEMPNVRSISKNLNLDESFLSNIESRGVVKTFNPSGRNMKLDMYRMYEEVNFENNIAHIEKGIPPIDLYVDKVEHEFSKIDEKLEIKGIVGFAEGARELNEGKGELPVKLVITWETEDGQKGTETYTYDEFKPGEEKEFTYTASIKMPEDGIIKGKYKVRVNPEPINPYEEDLTNNEVENHFGDSKFPDFSIRPQRGFLPKEKDGKNVELKFNAILSNTPEEINTNVVLYNGTTVVQTKNITFKGGESQVIVFDVPESVLKDEKSSISAVINANFNLTTATPFDKERDLTNNKAEMTIMLIEPFEPKSTSCTYDGLVDKDPAEYSEKVLVTAPGQGCNYWIDEIDVYGYTGAYYDSWGNPLKVECTNPRAPSEAIPGTVIATSYEYDEVRAYDYWGDLVGYRYVPVAVRYIEYEKCEIKKARPLQGTAEITYIKTEPTKNGIFSNQWHKIKEGQEYGKSKGLPTIGRKLDGQPAEDVVMSSLGHNPLRQVIQAGAGLQVRAKIKVKGSIEDYNRYVTAGEIQPFVDDIKNKSVYLTDYNSTGIKNNEGKIVQKMEYDASRSSELTPSSKYIIESSKKEEGPYGDSECGEPLFIHYLEYEFEIPVILTYAVGNIDVIGSNKEHKVPHERNWFVYMNQMNGVYELTVGTTLKPSLMQVLGDDTECLLTPGYKIGVFGTIFDNVNTDAPPGDSDGPPDWDN